MNFHNWDIEGDRPTRSIDDDVHEVRSTLFRAQEKDSGIRNGNNELVFGDIPRVKSFLSDVFKNSYEESIIISRLTLKDEFLLRVIVRNNRKRTIGNSFLFLTVLLVNEMLIRTKNNLLIA